MRNLLYCSLLFALPGASAQEYNLGIHFNPVATIPFMDGRSVYDKNIRFNQVFPGYNIGVNVNFKYNILSLETGLNIVQKAVQFKQHIISTDGTMAYFYSKHLGTSFEFPLLGAVKAFHNQGRTIYDLYIQGGASYELYDNNGITEGSGASGTGGVDIRQTSTVLPGAMEQKQWVNAILGFKINAIIKNLGLVDYGITYHLPFGQSGPYSVNSEVFSITGYHKYTGEFRPTLSYLDFKLCYYFLNYDKNMQRIRYAKY